MRLVSAATATPENQYTQDEVCDWYIRQAKGALDEAWIRAVFAGSCVQARRTVLPMGETEKDRNFGERNALFLKHARLLLTPTITAAIAQAGIAPEDVDGLVTITSSGFRTPSLDAYLLNDVKLSSNTRRMPIVGLGCAAGVSGQAHAIHWAMGAKLRNVVVVSVELNSLAFRPNEINKVNTVGTSLFGDGAAALVWNSEPKQGWTYVDSATYTLPNSTDLMGWAMDGEGFGLILSEDVPAAIAKMAPENLQKFLQKNNLTQSQIDEWILHPGGPKILHVLAKVTTLPQVVFDRSFASLAKNANLSSCSVPYMVSEFLKQPAKNGQHCMLVSFGPGFSMEMLLLKYHS